MKEEMLRLFLLISCVFLVHIVCFKSFVCGSLVSNQEFITASKQDKLADKYLHDEVLTSCHLTTREGFFASMSS